jgi:hypothetical protein
MASKFIFINFCITVIADNFNYKSATCYFIGKYYLDDMKNKNMAKSYFERVSARASESKYVNFCRNMVNE